MPATPQSCTPQAAPADLRIRSRPNSGRPPTGEWERDTRALLTETAPLPPAPPPPLTSLWGIASFSAPRQGRSPPGPPPAVAPGTRRSDWGRQPGWWEWSMAQAGSGAVASRETPTKRTKRRRRGRGAPQAAGPALRSALCAAASVSSQSAAPGSHRCPPPPAGSPHRSRQRSPQLRHPSSSRRRQPPHCCLRIIPTTKYDSSPPPSSLAGHIALPRLSNPLRKRRREGVGGGSGLVAAGGGMRRSSPLSLRRCWCRACSSGAGQGLAVRGRMGSGSGHAASENWQGDAEWEGCPSSHVALLMCRRAVGTPAASRRGLATTL